VGQGRRGLKAYVETVPVEVTDGKIKVTFTPKVENPQINAIESSRNQGQGASPVRQRPRLPRRRRPRPPHSRLFPLRPRGPPFCKLTRAKSLARSAPFCTG